MKVDVRFFEKEFGKRIKKLRLNKNLSQEMLANDADIPINQIGRIERAEISTSLKTIYKIAKALEVEVIDLFNFEQ
jgi:transcriptional regulator with XRE-family HTH domain